MPDPVGDAASTPADDLAGSAAARPEAVDDAASVGEPEPPFGAVRADVPADVPTDVCPLLVLIGPSTDVAAARSRSAGRTPPRAPPAKVRRVIARSRWAMTPDAGAALRRRRARPGPPRPGRPTVARRSGPGRTAPTAAPHRRRRRRCRRPSSDSSAWMQVTSIARASCGPRARRGAGASSRSPRAALVAAEIAAAAVASSTAGAPAATASSSGEAPTPGPTEPTSGPDHLTLAAAAAAGAVRGDHRHRDDDGRHGIGRRFRRAGRRCAVRGRGHRVGPGRHRSGSGHRST